ncbi:hypothetical protein [Rhodoferax sp. TH121]|uniref:hypothetical protein n=1 Tax=Rhodoferax sp. TH121 TaxID=2022803 RepID=UPI001595AA0F|nr:hypothetical protein [Rhodoferax sp. TH121]
MSSHPLRLGSGVILLAVAPSLWAQAQDVVTLRAGLSVLNADNFFRTSAANAVSERVTTQNTGINVVLPYGLQQFDLDASLTSNQYQTNSSFDYVGQNYSAAWRWSLTPRLTGNLRSARTETLNATTDSVNPNLRNKNKTQGTELSLAYGLRGPWQLTTGLSDNSSINERALVGQSDNRSTGANIGLRYEAAPGQTLAYALQQGRGVSNTDYTSTSHNFTALWAPSGKTSVNARLSHTQLRYGNTPQFDYSGIAGSVGADWRISGKTSLQASWQRDLSSYQTSGTTHVQTDSITVSPLWQISSETSLRLQYRHARRLDQGNPTGVATNRLDYLHDTSVSYTWQPRKQATLSVTLAESSRQSNIANADYVARQLTLAAQFAF